MRPPPERPRSDVLARRLNRLAGRRIGPHLPLVPGLRKAVDRAWGIGATAVQVFADNPTAWRRRAKPPAGIEQFRERLESLDIRPIAVHASYLINLCGSSDEFWRRSIETVVAELLMGARYGASYVTVHTGSHRGMGAVAGISRLATAVREIQDRTIGTSGLPILVLENSSGGGDLLGNRIEDMAEIIEACAREGADPDRLGFCLDTAHLWAVGYAINDPDEMDRLLVDMDAALGPRMLRMLHLNDSRAPLGSHQDRHEHIGAGGIGERGMHAILTHPRLAEIPTFLETPGMDTGYDAVNMDRVRGIVAGRPLPPLRAAAFAPSASRRRMPRRRPARLAEETPDVLA